MLFGGWPSRAPGFAVGYVGFRDQIGGRRFGLLRVNRHDADGPIEMPASTASARLPLAFIMCPPSVGLSTHP